MIDARYDFMFFVQCKNCNPNGDPNAGNLPRQFDANGHGYMTDASIKRKIRDYISAIHGGEPGMQIFVEDGTTLNRKIAEAKQAAGLPFGEKKVLSDSVDKAREKACEMFYDVRTFGAVMSTGPNAGQVRGPVQINFAESVDPVMPEEISVTRCADTGLKSGKSLDDYKKAESEMADAEKRTIGTKQFIPFGLYVVTGHVSANEAMKTGFDMKDLGYLFEACANMFEYTRTSTKSGMSVVSPVIVFRHTGDPGVAPDVKMRQALLGCAPAYRLFDLMGCSKKEGVAVSSDYTDYDMVLYYSNKPKFVDIGLLFSYSSDIMYLTDADVDTKVGILSIG